MREQVGVCDVIIVVVVGVGLIVTITQSSGLWYFLVVFVYLLAGLLWPHLHVEILSGFSFSALEICDSFRFRPFFFL